MKALFHNGAMSAIQHCTEIKEYYQRKVGEGKNEMLVMNNVGNKLVHRIFACVSRREKYNENYIQTFAWIIEIDPLRQDSKICLMVALVVMAYGLSIQQGLENKVEKKKIYRNKPSRLAISYFRQGLSIIKAKIWSLRMFIGVLNDIFKNADQGKLLYVQ